MVRKRLKLNEDSPISTKVMFMTGEIRDILLRNLQYSPKYMSKESDSLIKKGSFAYKPRDVMNLESFMVTYMVYYFDNEKEFKAFYKLYRKRLISETDYERNTIHYRFALINDRIPKEFDSMLQNELSYFFQNYNSQEENEILYNKLKDIISSTTNDFDKHIANALYLSFNTEIETFANQYYVYLKQNNIGGGEAIDCFPNGEGNPYHEFDNYYNEVVNIEEYLNDEHLKEVFGLSIEQIFNRLENADKRYKNKMVKVNSLYNKEIRDKHIKEVKNLNMSIVFGVRLNFELDCRQMGIYETESEFD